MTQPLYFIPNIEARDLIKAQRLNRDVLRAHGLEEVFADLTREEDVSVQELRTGGPLKMGGVLLCYLKEGTRDVPQNLGTYDGINKWEVRDPQFKALIGWNPDQPPTPEDLRRKRMHRGYLIEGADGNEWQVPIIRRPDDSTELPRDMYVNGDGRLHEPVKEQYREYWEETELVCGWFLHPEAGLEAIGFSKEKAFRMAVRALSINYRYGHAEQRICKAIDSVNFLTVLAWTVDKPRFDEVSAAAKKKPVTSDTPSSTPGSPEESPATDPAVLTSV